jgi:hypothetical protein
MGTAACRSRELPLTAAMIHGVTAVQLQRAGWARVAHSRNCPLSQYIKIAPARTFAIDEASQVLAFWIAEPAIRRNTPTRCTLRNAAVPLLDGTCCTTILTGCSFYICGAVLPSSTGLNGTPSAHHVSSSTEPIYFLKPTLRTPEISKRSRIERD